VVYRGTSACL